MKLTLSLLLSLFLSSHLRAQTEGSYDLAWFTIDGGGGVSSGGRYSLTGVIGQPDAGQLSGGDFIMEGGFFYKLGTPINAGGPLLQIRRAATSGFVELVWPVDVEGFTLEATTDLANLPWQPVAEPVVNTAIEHVVTIPILSNRLFRLRKVQP